jgi:hypothetical protein
MESRRGSTTQRRQRLGRGLAVFAAGTMLGGAALWGLIALFFPPYLPAPPRGPYPIGTLT